MKKIIFGLLLLFSVATRLSAQVEGAQVTKYWYYPSQNIYYNEATGDYWYYDTPNSKWIMAVQLPDSYKMADADERYEVYYKGTEVWKDNKAHRMKYKVKKNGRVKQKDR